MAKVWCVYQRHARWCGTRPRCWLPMGNCAYWLLTRDRKYLMRASPFRGVSVSEVWSKSWRHDAPPDALLERRGRTSVKKPKLSERSAVKHLAALESEYLADVQGVVDAIGMLQYADGTPRQAGYLGVWVQGSVWVVRIQDKDAEAQLTAEGRTLDEALDVLAHHLGCEDAPWEPMGRRKKKGG